MENSVSVPAMHRAIDYAATQLEHEFSELNMKEATFLGQPKMHTPMKEEHRSKLRKKINLQGPRGSHCQNDGPGSGVLAADQPGPHKRGTQGAGKKGYHGESAGDDVEGEGGGAWGADDQAGPLQGQ
ncbi:hypothetical protein PG990_014560 [Apiospora arundinis]